MNVILIKVAQVVLTVFGTLFIGIGLYDKFKGGKK